MTFSLIDERAFKEIHQKQGKMKKNRKPYEGKLKLKGTTQNEKSGKRK